MTYVYTDAQGTPLAEADASGNITARFDYTPYGVSVPSVGPAPNGPGYTGHVNDPDTGLVYMQARYYDPSVGRFLSVDPIGPSPGNTFNFNRYDYANNNPYKFIDPDGRRGELFWTAPGQVTYTIRWTMTGVPTSNFTPAAVNAQIAQDFSGAATINGTNVTITAQGVYVATPGARPVNTVNVVPDTAGVTPTGTAVTNKIGGDQVTAGASGQQRATPLTMSHELGGHAGGAGDQYARGKGANGQTLSADVPGPDNMMKNLTGQPANAQSRQEILQAPTNSNACARGVHAANGGC